MRVLIALTTVLVAGCLSEPDIGEPRVEGVCVYGAPLGFDGSTNGTARASLNLDQLDFDLGLAQGSAVTMADAVISTGPGIVDFGFVERMKVELLPSNQPAVPISEAAVVSQGISVTLRGNPDLNLAGYLTDSPDVAIEISGDVPSASWSAVLDLCFDVAAP